MATRQYDVYIENESIDQDDKLILVQFPALKSQFFNDADQLSLSIKPKCMKLKLEVDLDHKAKNFSSRKSELLSEKSKPQIFPNRKVDKNIYSSTRNDTDDSQLFICKTVGIKLVCRPVSNVVTLRSDLTHFDLKEEVDPREEVRPVSVKFAATDRQSAPIKPKESQQEIDEALEDYKSFKLSDADSDAAKLQREFLFGIPCSGVTIKPDPDACFTSDQKPAIASQDLDVKPKIERMDLDDVYTSVTKNLPGPPKISSVIRNRVRECLVKAKIVSLYEVYKFLREYRDMSGQKMDGNQMQINVKDILDALSEHAVLVRGNWAVKSEVLYGDSTVRGTTDVTAISINLFIAARDYLLWLFNQDNLVSRPSYSKQVRIPDQDAVELFNQLGVFQRESKKWQLKLPTDKKFLENFPEIVQRQNTFWRVRQANKLTIFSKS